MTRFAAQKRAEWQKRLEEYEASGLTIGQFCKRSDVSPHTFYYWRKRLRRSSGKSRREAALQPAGKTGGEVAATAKEVGYSGPLVQLAWGSSLHISIPAHCVDAIRCVLECAGHAGHHPDDVARTFQEVVLAK
jgi:hypothetical protein